jgi:hypothetical protein
VHESSRGSAGHGGAVRALAAARCASECSAQMRQAHGSRAGPRDRGCGTLTRHAAAEPWHARPKRGDGAVHPGRVHSGLLSRPRQAVAGQVGPEAGLAWPVNGERREKRAGWHIFIDKQNWLD